MCSCGVFIFWTSTDSLLSLFSVCQFTFLSRSNEAVQKYTQEGRARGWMDNIIISQDTQATILKYAPIIGPIVGSAAIVALYLLARLVKVGVCSFTFLFVRLQVGSLLSGAS